MESSINAVIIDRIFTGATAKNIRYCILRNYSELPESTLGGDIDLIVHPKDSVHWVDHLEDVASSFNLKLGVIQKHYHGIRFCLWGPEIMFFVKLDVHYGEYWRGVEYLDAVNILSTCRENNKIKIPSTVNEAILSLIDPLITGGKPKEKYKLNITEAVELYEETFFDSLASIVGITLSREITALIKNDTFSEISTLASNVRCNLWVRKYFEFPGKSLISIINYFKYELGRRIKPLGILIALHGTQEDLGIFIDSFISTTHLQLPGINLNEDFSSLVNSKNSFTILKLLQSYNIVLCSSENYNQEVFNYLGYEIIKINILHDRIHIDNNEFDFTESIAYIYEHLIVRYINNYKGV